MDNKLAAQVLMHFDYNAMQTLEAYVNYRSDIIHNQMETTTDADQWRRLQGQIQELKTILKIRDIATAVKDKGNG